MNGWDTLLIVVLASAVVLAALRIAKNRKQGKTCGDSCAGCVNPCDHKKET